MDGDLATPKGQIFFSIDDLRILAFLGVLMEEAGDTIEFLLFAFRIQHYGPEHPNLHEFPNSTSNINDIHEAYFHFENKRHAVQEGTHVN